MTEDDVRQRLTTYRVERAALDGLTVSRMSLQRELSIMQKDRLETLAGPRAQVVSDMPHGTTVGNPTEQAALAMIEDAPGEMLLKAQIAEADMQITELTERCAIVEAWMRMLNDREKYVVENRVVKRLPWAYVRRGYAGMFGIDLAERQLSTLEKSAFGLICKAAENVL